MTDDPDGALPDSLDPEHDKNTVTQPQKMGLAFYGALGLVGVLVFLIVFMNVQGTRASAGTLLTQHPWTLESYADSTGILAPAIAGTPITAMFGTDGKVNGSSGCNQYIANYSTQNLAISISRPVITGKYCENPLVMQQEQAYLGDLSKAVEIRVNESNLHLYDETGKPVLVFGTIS
jgi:heat shock protein HslJ